jgi:hypothetical protein
MPEKVRWKTFNLQKMEDAAIEADRRDVSVEISVSDLKILIPALNNHANHCDETARMCLTEFWCLQNMQEAKQCRELIEILKKRLSREELRLQGTES